MLVRSKFAYSKKVFALNPSTFEIKQGRDRYYYSVDAIWFGRRKATKRRAVFSGKVSFSDYTLLNYDEFLTKVPSQPYGDCWDGQEVWGTTNFWEQKKIVEALDPILKMEPNVPANYDCWYEYIK